MKSKNIYYKVFVLLLFSVIVLSFLNCDAKWYFSIISSKDLDNVVFCFSRFKNCKGNGISLAGLDIIEIDKRGELIQVMWVIIPVSNSNIRKMVYGKIPEGFKETWKAVPLELNKIYSVRGS